GPLVAAELLGSAGAILVFVVVFASLASSIDSLLAATSDLLVHDVLHGLARRHHTDQARRRKQVGWVIVGLGVVTWLACLPRLGTLATVLFFAGPLVGSTVWPLLAGLFWRRANARAATWAMIAGSTIGLCCYLTIGWYTGALVGTTVSMLIVVLGTLLAPQPFDWSRIREARP